jgi:malate/lactate dehydrogenase
VHLAERFAVSPACIEANVVGEHGTSSVFLWSSARIGGMGVADALAKRGSGFDAFRREVEQDVRYANIMIIEGLGASQYGVGMVAARVAEVVLRDERAVFPVGAHNARYGVALCCRPWSGQGVSKRSEAATLPCRITALAAFSRADASDTRVVVTALPPVRRWHAYLPNARRAWRRAGA